MSVFALPKEKQQLLFVANLMMMLLEVKSDLLVVLICLLFRTGVRNDSAGMARMRPAAILQRKMRWGDSLSVCPVEMAGSGPSASLKCCRWNVPVVCRLQTLGRLGDSSQRDVSQYVTFLEHGGNVGICPVLSKTSYMCQLIFGRCMSYPQLDGLHVPSGLVTWSGLLSGLIAVIVIPLAIWISLTSILTLHCWKLWVLCQVVWCPACWPLLAIDPTVNATTKYQKNTFATETEISVSVAYIASK